MRQLSCLLLVLPLLFIACNNDKGNTPQRTTTTLLLTSDSTMSFTAEGGEGTITYSLTTRDVTRRSPVEAKIAEVTTSASWITIIDATPEAITFRVAANDGDRRRDRITVSYDTESFNVNIIQDAVVIEYDMVVEMAAAMRIVDEEDVAESTFVMEFIDDAETTLLTLALAGEEGDGILQPGEYSTERDNILTELSEIEIYDPATEINIAYYIEEAEIEVGYNNDIYTFNMVLTTGDKRLWHVTYEGVILNMEDNSGVGSGDGEDKEFDAPYYGCAYIPNSSITAHNYYVILTDGDPYDENDMPNATYYCFDIYSDILDANAPVLPKGTYTFDATESCEAGTMNGYYTYGYTTDSEAQMVDIFEYTSGTLTVTENRIVAVMTLLDGSVHTITYDGDLYVDVDIESLSTLEEDITLTGSGFGIIANNYGDEIAPNMNNWIITLYEDYNLRSGIYLSFDIMTDIAAENYAGEYTVSTENETYTYYPGYIADDMLYGSWYAEVEDNEIVGDMAPITEGKVTITIARDGTQTFTLECTDDAGNKICGTLTGTPVPITYTLNQTPKVMSTIKINKRAFLRD